MNIIIIILTTILITFDAIHAIIDPTIAMCIDGEIDTAVRTQDGSTYLFMSSWFWKLKPDLSGVEGNASKISDHWNSLPDNIETSFYISSERNALDERTFFIKNQIWYKFFNQELEEWGSTSNWTGYPRMGEIFAISQSDDPMIVFFQKHYYKFRPKAYYFDSSYFPEMKSLVDNNIPFDTYETEAFVSYPDGKTLIFFDDNRIGGHCIIKSNHTGCDINRLNSDLFECPEYTKGLFGKNLLIRIWFWSGLGLKQFMILLLGIVVSISFVLLFIILIVAMQVWKLAKRYRKNNKSKDQ